MAGLRDGGWEVLPGDFGSFFRRVSEATAEASGINTLVIAEIDRKPTARESLNDFYDGIYDGINKGEVNGNKFPPNALYEMKGVGVVVRDKTGQKVMGHDNLWHLYAQADLHEDHINIWAVHHLGGTVAHRKMPRDFDLVVCRNFGDTQRFTFANGDNTTTDVLPDMNNLPDYEIIFLNLDVVGEETKVKIESDWTMQMLCTAYAQEKGKHVRSFRFAYAGKPLFLSSIGKKLVTQVGLVNRDVVVVSSVELPPDEWAVVQTMQRKVGQRVAKQRTRSLDLHGLTSKEAIAKLDEKVMEWVDIAMGSSYPFVIPVAIVCGGGNQVLSETVAKWIKSKREVANAPKNYHG